MGPAAPGGAVTSRLSRVEHSRLEGTSREVRIGAPPFLLPPSSPAGCPRAERNRPRGRRRAPQSATSGLSYVTTE